MTAWVLSFPLCVGNLRSIKGFIYFIIDAVLYLTYDIEWNLNAFFLKMRWIIEKNEQLKCLVLQGFIFLR